MAMHVVVGDVIPATPTISYAPENLNAIKVIYMSFPAPS